MKQEINSSGHPHSLILVAFQWDTANTDFTLIKKVLFGGYSMECYAVIIRRRHNEEKMNEKEGKEWRFKKYEKKTYKQEIMKHYAVHPM